MTEIHHPLTAADGRVMDGIRTITASAKGHVERGPFDAALEQTPDAARIAYEPGMVGGVAGVWCRPADDSRGPTILYLRGGAYIVGTADDARGYSPRAAAEHVDVALHVWEGMPHVFPSNVGRLMATDQGARFNRGLPSRRI
jgi:acetyl esterase/lipase